MQLSIYFLCYKIIKKNVNDSFLKLYYGVSLKISTTQKIPSTQSFETHTRKHFHQFPTSRHYLQPSTESFVLKFKSTLQSVFYTLAPAILIVHKAPNSGHYD